MFFFCGIWWKLRPHRNQVMFTQDFVFWHRALLRLAFFSRIVSAAIHKCETPCALQFFLKIIWTWGACPVYLAVKSFCVTWGCSKLGPPNASWSCNPILKVNMSFTVCHIVEISWSFSVEQVSCLLQLVCVQGNIYVCCWGCSDPKGLEHQEQAKWNVVRRRGCRWC